MKKSSFIALVLGTISGLLFALGMCMALLSEWNAFKQGIIFGSLGLILGFVTLMLWRKMEHKAPIKLCVKTIGVIAVSIIGALTLGVGMCLCLIWEKMIAGIIIGILGIIILLSLLPLTKGIKE